MPCHQSTVKLTVLCRLYTPMCMRACDYIDYNEAFLDQQLIFSRYSLLISF